MSMIIKFLTIVFCVYQQLTSTSCAPGRGNKREKRAPQEWWLNQGQSQNANTDQNNQPYIIVYDSDTGTTSKPTVIDIDVSYDQGGSVNFWKTLEITEPPPNRAQPPDRTVSPYDNRTPAPMLPPPNDVARPSAVKGRPPASPNEDKSFSPPETAWGSNDTYPNGNAELDWERWRRRGWGRGPPPYYPRGPHYPGGGGPYHRGWGYGRGPHYPYHRGWGYGNDPHRRGPPDSSPYDRQPNDGDSSQSNDRQGTDYDGNQDGLPGNNNLDTQYRNNLQSRIDNAKPRSNRRRPGGLALINSDGTPNNFAINGRKSTQFLFQAMAVTPEV